MKPRASDSERVIDYLTALARDQDVHVVTLDAILGACDIRPLKWPELFEKHLKDVEAVPGRDAYRLRKKRNDLMTRLTDEERVVDHLLKVGSASPADIRRALGLAESDTKEILHRLSQDGRAQHEGRGRGVRWSLVETRPVPPPVEATSVAEGETAAQAGPLWLGQAREEDLHEHIHDMELAEIEATKDLTALRKAVAGHVGMSERASNERLIQGLETMRANVSADRMALQETQDALAAERRALADAEARREEALGYAEDWQALAEQARREAESARGLQAEAEREAAVWKSRANAAQSLADQYGADTDAVRLLVQALDGETLEAAVVRHLAKLDHHVESLREEVAALNRRHNTTEARLVGERDRAEDLIEVVYKALGLTKETASDEAITKAISDLVVATEGEIAAARTIAGMVASPDGRIPYEVLEQRLAHYRRAWCDLAGAVTGTPTDKAGEHGEMEVGAVLAIATRRRVDADTAADLPAIIDRLAKERDEARSQRDELERRAEATNDALWELRRKARRNLDRARIKLADAQNRLDAIESVPLAGDPIPF